MKLEIKNLLGNSFDTMYDVEPSMMICTPALDPTEPIQGYTDLTLNAKLNEVSELNLCVHKITEDGQLNPCYGLVEKRKYIYMEGVGYFRITDCSEENGGDDDIKKIITAESKEAELGNINVPDLGTTDYKTGAISYTLKFYNSDPNVLESEPTKLNDCVIRRIQNALIGWSFDLSSLTKRRAAAQSAYTFGTSDGGQESIGENIYNFLTTTVADAFEIIFLFDTLNSKIIPIYRDEYYNKTSLFFDRENIVESSRRNEKEGTFCTCLELSPNEDLIPYLNMVNPTGKYLYDFSYYWKRNGWMDQNLKDAIMLWEATVKAQGDGSSDPQISRCLKAWTAAKSMNEKARKNSDLYHQQYIALTAAQGSESEEDVAAAINNMANLDSDVINRAAIRRENGENVSYASINTGLKNINILKNLSDALGFNSNYRSYFKEASIQATNYNIVPNDGVGELTECDRLIFRFRCTSLPGTSSDSTPILISLSFNGISVSNPDVYSVRKILSSGAIDSKSSDIEIYEDGSHNRFAQINKVNEANEYYEVEWAIGAINTNPQGSPNYVKSIEIYGDNHSPNSPNVKLQFSPNQNFILSDAEFEANASDYYTYVNSDFVMDSTMKKPNTNTYGYHIWTPAFRVFNNVIDPDWNVGTAEDPIYPFDKETNIIDGTYIQNIQYVTHSAEAELNPWLFVYFNEVDNENIKVTDIASADWDYTPFPDELVENSNSDTTIEGLTGYEIRLHFYGYVKLGDAWTFKKLKIEGTENDYLSIVPDNVPSSDPFTPFTFPSILRTNLPKYGNFKDNNDTTRYTEVQYIRIEALTGDASIFNTLTILDPNLNYNAQNTDLLSFNSGGKYYPENYFDGVTTDTSNGKSIKRPPYSRVFPYISTLEYTNDNIIVLDTDDMTKREELALEFITEAKKQFKQNTTPVMECTVDSGAEIFSRDYIPIRDELALGSFCQVEFDTDDYSELPLEEISINWQECNFSMTFGTFRKKGSRWADLISQTISNQKSMDVKTTKLYSYVLDDTLGSVNEMLTTGRISAESFNIETNPNNYTRSYKITNGGITFSSKDSDGNSYEVLIADGSIACSKLNERGFRETTTALGKYVVGGQTQWGLYGGAIIAHTITADKIEVGGIGGWTIDPNQMFHSIIPEDSSDDTSDDTSEDTSEDTKYIDALISAEGVSSIDGYSIPSVGINSSSKTWKLLFGGLTGSGGTMNYTFGVDSDGNLYAQNANISGTVNASYGSIGGWTIGTDRLSHKTNNVVDARIIPGGAQIPLPENLPSGVTKHGVNDGNIFWQLLFGSTPNFGVDKEGILYANGAKINGTITVSENENSSLGGWTVTSSLMEHKSNNITDGYINPGGGTVSDIVQGGVNDGSISWNLLLGTGQKFGVTSAGDLWANGAHISGIITSTEGSIGGWTIEEHQIAYKVVNGGTDAQGNPKDVYPIALRSNGQIPTQYNGGGRTLIGIFVPGSSQDSSIRLPDYKKANVASDRTWQILTGENNTFNFGVTQDGRVYGKSFGAVDGLISSTLLQFYQRFHLSSYDNPYLDNAYNRLHMGNIYQPECDDVLLFPDGTDGTVGDDDYDGPLPVAGGLWQVLIGYNDTFDFGINRWGVPFSSSTYYYQSVIGSGQARGETYPPGTIGTIPNVIADVSTSSGSHHGQIYIGDIDASQSSTFSGTFPDGQGYAAQTKNYLMLAGCDNNLKFGVDYEGTPYLPNTFYVGGEQFSSVASSSTLGGIKVGSGLSIDTSGVLSTQVQKLSPTKYLFIDGSRFSTGISSTAHVMGGGTSTYPSLCSLFVHISRSLSVGQVIQIPLLELAASSPAYLYLRENTYTDTGDIAGSLKFETSSQIRIVITQATTKLNFNITFPAYFVEAQ